MANKRQKKKQQKIKIITAAKQSGYTQKEIKQLDRAELNKIYTSLINKERKAERQRRRYALLIKNGVPPKEANKMRGWSDERIDEYLKKLKRQRILKNQQKEFLILFWNDLVDITDEELPSLLRSHARTLSQSELIKEIKVLLYMNMGEIGACQMTITENVDGWNLVFHDQVIVYKGKAQRYRNLLEAIHIMMNLLYDAMDKFLFVNEFIQNVAYFSTLNAERLKADLL